jgi:putative FmdB family regulatory protein
VPTYDYRCAQGHTFEGYASMADSGRATTCVRCGALAEKVILRAPRVVGDYAPYECPVTGRWIEGKREHEENLRRTGCHVMEGGEVEAEERRRVAAEAAEEAVIEEAVERTAGELLSN